MTDGIFAEPIGVDQIVAKLDGYVARARPALMTAMEKIVFTIVGFIKDDELSGQVLHRRTGTLSRSIQGRVTESGSNIVGNVASRIGNEPLVYAAYHEYGFTGSENVREHQRKTASGGVANVRAYVRNVNYPAHPFMRPARDAHVQFATDTLNAAISEVNKS